jgi:hypothetical protein
VGRLTNKVALSLYGRAASTALVKRGHSGAMLALDRLALTAVLPAERYLICQADH